MHQSILKSEKWNTFFYFSFFVRAGHVDTPTLNVLNAGDDAFGEV